MAFGIGSSSKISKWFDYSSSNSTIRFKIKSIENENFQAHIEIAQNEYQSQLQDSGVLEKKPYHYYLYRAYSHLVEDWQGVDIQRVAEDGSNDYLKNISFSTEALHEILFSGSEGAALWLFIDKTAKQIKIDFDVQREKILGKSSSSSSGASSATKKKRATTTRSKPQ